MTTQTVTLHIHSPDSTRVVFTPTAAEWSLPIDIGFHFGRIAVEPPGWSGDLSLNGQDAGFFELDSNLDLSAAVAFSEARDYVITLTAAP